MRAYFCGYRTSRKIISKNLLIYNNTIALLLVLIGTMAY